MGFPRQPSIRIKHCDEEFRVNEGNLQPCDLAFCSLLSAKNHGSRGFPSLRINDAFYHNLPCSAGPGPGTMLVVKELTAYRRFCRGTEDLTERIHQAE
jgi:hypothetical protein